MHFSWWISSTALFGNPFAKHQTALQLHNCADRGSHGVNVTVQIRFFQFTVGQRHCLNAFLPVHSGKLYATVFVGLLKKGLYCNSIYGMDKQRQSSAHFIFLFIMHFSSFLSWVLCTSICLLKYFVESTHTDTMQCLFFVHQLLCSWYLKSYLVRAQLGYLKPLTSLCEGDVSVAIQARDVFPCVPYLRLFQAHNSSIYYCWQSYPPPPPPPPKHAFERPLLLSSSSMASHLILVHRGPLNYASRAKTGVRTFKRFAHLF